MYFGVCLLKVSHVLSKLSYTVCTSKTTFYFLYQEKLCCISEPGAMDSLSKLPNYTLTIFDILFPLRNCQHYNCMNIKMSTNYHYLKSHPVNKKTTSIYSTFTICAQIYIYQIPKNLNIPPTDQSL